MKYVGWKKERIKDEDPNVHEIRAVLEVYVFDDPEIVKYESDYVGVRPKNGYKSWFYQIRPIYN